MEHRRAVELLTQAQVFTPAVVPDLANGGFIVFSAMRIIGRGQTIDAAVKDARDRGNVPDVPPRPRYTGAKNEVHLRGEVVAIAKSRTYADRIANALNQYNPNERGI
jgi:hypothetical protein